jgi:outer membrane protein assembly factor BamB
MNKLLLACLIFTSIAITIQAQPVKGGDWTSFTLNNNNTRYQANSTINATNVAQLVPAWNIFTNWSVTSTPLVQNGNVYFADWGGNAFSANILTGSINWRENLGGGISSTPLISNGIMYVALGPNGAADVGHPVNALTGNTTVVFALNQYTGKLIWINNLNKTTKMNAIWASPIIYKNLLYIGVASAGDESEAAWKGAIYALNANNGAMVWNTLGTPNTDGYGSIVLAGTDGGDGVWGTVVIDPQLNSIYFGTGNPYSVKSPTNTLYGYSIISLNATNGKMNWHNQVYNALRGVNNTPPWNGMISNGMWNDDDFGSTPNLFSFTSTSTGLTYSALGLGNKDGNYFVIDRINGTMLEKVSIGTSEDNANPDGGVIGSGAETNTTNPEIFVPSYYDLNNSVQGDVVAFYPSNYLSKGIAWRFDAKGVVDGGLTVVNNAVLFEDYGAQLYAVSTKTGKSLWTHAIPAAGASGITVAEGYVIGTGLFSLNGNNATLGIYAFTLPKQSLLTLSSPIFPTNSTFNSIVHVNGVGFHANSVITFGYGAQFAGNYSKIMITANSSPTGTWSGTFHAPWETGTYEMFAQDTQGTLSNVNMVVSTPTGSSSTTTTSTTTLSTTTIPNTCSGTPSLTLNPNPSVPSSSVNAIVSGLIGCSGVTVNIESYQGCTTGTVLASFISNSTGGSTFITSPGANGQYGYWACVNNQSKEATLVVSTSATSTTTIPTTTSATTTSTTSALTTSLTTSSTTTSLPTTSVTTTLPSTSVTTTAPSTSVTTTIPSTSTISVTTTVPSTSTTSVTTIPSTSTTSFTTTIPSTSTTSISTTISTSVSTSVTTTIAPLAIASPAPSSQNVTLGNNAIINNSGASGGIGPYTYQWLEEVPGSITFANATDCLNPTAITCNFMTNALTTLGVYTFELNATDSEAPANTVTSTTVNVTVSNSSSTISSTTTTTSISTSLSTTSASTTTSSASTSTAPTTSATTSSASTSTTTSTLLTTTSTAPTTTSTTTSSVASTTSTLSTTTSTAATTTSTSSVTTTIPANETQKMINTLKNNGFTNVIVQQPVATISAPAMIFLAFDKNAYGTGQSGNVLVYALPFGDEYLTWNSATPTTYSYFTNQSNAVLKGTITFDTIPANGFFGGSSSGDGNWITWKELVAYSQYKNRVV